MYAIRSYYGLFVDLFREYRVESFGLGTGQIINLCMSVIGLLLLIWFYLRGRRLPTARSAASPRPAMGNQGILIWRRPLFMLVLLFCLTMPSDWTQDIPARYGARHPGLHYSVIVITSYSIHYTKLYDALQMTTLTT